MQNIRISQDNTIVKHIGDFLLDYLYKLSKANNENNQYMKGRLEVTHGYQDAIDFLTGKFEDLYIVSTGDPYIRFTDSTVQTLLANRIGDGVGVTTPQARSLSNYDVLYALFHRNGDITSFNELKLFTNITSLRGETFLHCDNLTSVDVSNIETFLGGNVFAGCDNLTTIIGLENLKEIQGQHHFNECNLTGDIYLTGIINDNGWPFGFNNNPNIDTIYLSPNITIAPLCYRSGVKKIVGGTGVTKILSESYLQAKSLQSVDYPNVERIENSNVFSGCTSLTSINFPLCTFVGNGAFSNCTNLKTVNLPSANNIQAYAFNYCENLETLNIGNITQLPTKIFTHCYKLENININWALITSIGEEVLHSCPYTNDIDHPIVLSSCNNIKYSAFSGCKIKYIELPALTQESIEENNTNIAWSNFVSIKLNTNITKILGNMFKRNSYLTTMSGLSNVTEVGEYAFEEDFELASLDFSNKLKKIGTRAFSLCKKLQSLDENIKPTHIGEFAFSSCQNLESINLTECISLSEYAFNDCPKLTSLQFSPNLTVLGNKTFSNCKKLSTLTGLSGVTTINDEVFRYSYTNIDGFEYGLTSTDFSSNLKHIGNNAFAGCCLLSTFATETVYPEFIGENAFAGCQHFNGPINLSQCTQFGNYAFNGCYALQSIGSLNENITNIPTKLFSGCKKLTSITGLSNVTTTESESFTECSMLQTLDFSNKIKNIGRYSFNGCESLTSLSSVTIKPQSVGENAFAGCKALTGGIDLSECTSLGKYAFSTCQSLTSIGTLNSELTELPQGVFNSSGLTGNLDIPASVTKLGHQVFHDIRNLTSVTFHSLTPPTVNSGDKPFWYPAFEIRVPNEALETYKAANGFSSEVSKIVGY